MREHNKLLDKIFTVVEIAGTAILMNLLFLVCCLPIVTIGQAWSGLISAVRFSIRGDGWFQGFKKGFKTRFFRGTAAWCVMLAIDVHMLLDLHYNIAGGYTVPMIASAIMFALGAMVTTALLMLNVYVPTKGKLWISSAAAMVFKAPLQLLTAALLNWLPVLLALLWVDIFIFTIMIYIAAYFSFSAFASTFILKNTLLDYLIDARKDGTLLAEDGKSYHPENSSEAEE